MFNLNGKDLTENITIKSVQMINARKNNYLSKFGGVTKATRVPGKIKVVASLNHTNDDELIKNLNGLENKLVDGTLEYGGKEYSVTVSQGTYQGMDLANINLVFSWDGYVFENNSNTDLAI